MFEIHPMGDSALVLVFGEEISESVNQRVTHYAAHLRAQHHPAIVELVPTYRSLLVTYDPFKTSFARMRLFLEALGSAPEESQHRARRILEIPVLYGGEYGPDLGFVAHHAQLSEEEVISIHSGTDYRIFMIGFLPGFCYLGGMDSRIITPRLEQPRVRIPGGSVGIGGESTGVYPIDSPGGWQLIGRTPLKPYDPHRDPIIAYEAGDYLRFVPIGFEEYQHIENQVAGGSYEFRWIEEG